MIDSLFMYLSAARDYSFLRDMIFIFIRNGIWCCKLFLCFFRDCHIIVVHVLEFLEADFLFTVIGYLDDAPIV